MTAAIITLAASIIAAAGYYMKFKTSASRQRSIAKAEIAKEDAAIAAKRDEIREAVYSGDDEKLNQIVAQLLAPVLFCVLFGAVFLGCATRPAVTVYVPTDRRIETCTNSLGIVCKAVPNAVMDEMLVKLQELKDLKAEQKVESRVAE